jgi:hypothetical protein
MWCVMCTVPTTEELLIAFRLPQSWYTSIVSYRYNAFLLAAEILTAMLHTNIELKRKNCRMVPTLTL